MLILVFVFSSDSSFADFYLIVFDPYAENACPPLLLAFVTALFHLKFFEYEIKLSKPVLCTGRREGWSCCMRVRYQFCCTFFKQRIAGCWLPVPGFDIG